MQFYTMPVVEVREEAPGVKTFLFNIPKDLTWEPAEHMHVALPGFRGTNGERHRELVRVMNVCTLMNEGLLGFTTRLVSSDTEFKRRLAEMGAGDEMTMFKFQPANLLPRDGRPVVVLSQGVAVAAARPLVLAAAEDATGIPTLTSLDVDRFEPGIFHEELERRASERIIVKHATDREGMVSNIHKVEDPAGCTFVVMGSEGFVRGNVERLRAMGVADEHILLDKGGSRRAAYFA